MLRFFISHIYIWKDLQGRIWIGKNHPEFTALTLTSNDHSSKKGGKQAPTMSENQCPPMLKNQSPTVAESQSLTMLENQSPARWKTSIRQWWKTSFRQLSINIARICGGSAFVCTGSCTVHKYIYRNVYFTIMAPVEYLICQPYADCGEIRQTLDAKMRQIF